MVGFGSHQDVLNTLEGALKGRDHLVGDSFTAADLYIAAHLGWGMQFGTIEKRPDFVRYAELHTGRAAARRANEIDDGLIAAQQQKQPEPAE